MTLKVYETGHRQARNEEVVLRHLERLESEHPGQKLLRSIKDSFELQGKIGPHVCLIFETLGLSLADIRELAGGKLPENLLKGLIYGLLLGIDYMHSVAHVVHTGEDDCASFFITLPLGASEGVFCIVSCIGFTNTQVRHSGRKHYALNFRHHNLGRTSERRMEASKCEKSHG